MYVAHPFLKQPPDNARLWRYMKPTIFLSTLLSRSLHFARLDSVEDPFESVPPPTVLEAARRERDPNAEAARRLDTWKRMISLCRTSLCASCWHVDDEESEAMWKLYGRFEDGLIVTTLKSIKAAFGNHEVTGGLVDYSGREFEAGTTEESLLQWATIKRPSYRHENELRLLVRREPNRGVEQESRPRHPADNARPLGDEAGVPLAIDPEVLIEDVVLSPRMERWQMEFFRGLLDLLGFERPVHASSLLTSPF